MKMHASFLNGICDATNIWYSLYTISQFKDGIACQK